MSRRVPTGRATVAPPAASRPRGRFTTPAGSDGSTAPKGGPRSAHGRRFTRFDRISSATPGRPASGVGQPTYRVGAGWASWTGPAGWARVGYRGLARLPWAAAFVPGPTRPLYSRVLRLGYVDPGNVLCFLFFEGSLILAALLALAELMSWWAIPLIPGLVAIAVKINDVVAAAVARSAARVPISERERFRRDLEPAVGRAPVPVGSSVVPPAGFSWIAARPSAETTQPQSVSVPARRRRTARDPLPDGRTTRGGLVDFDRIRVSMARTVLRSLTGPRRRASATKNRPGTRAARFGGPPLSIVKQYVEQQNHPG